MNLIEQFGYDGAKSYLALNRLKSWYEDGCKELLEHRRQHNIFEVGDKVVVKAEPFWPEDYVIHTVEQEHIGKWYMSAWRHATDEEIAAGHILKQGE